MVEESPEGHEQPLQNDPLLRRIPEVEGYKVLEPCVLYAKVGEGGMGAVYRGRHINLDIDVAIKCLKHGVAEQSPAFVTRFQREARIAASVHHQNLVQVYDISEKNGVHYLVMEYVRGETARERVVRKKRLKESEALKIMFGAASGLAEAHDKRIVHRDIKPDNILISYDGTVKVSDLGLAKALEVDSGPSLTIGVMGTPQYMAPEQWEDSATVGPQADVWALGATFYFLLTGDHAIPGGSMQQIYRRICVDPFPAIQEKMPKISSQAKAILERCVQQDPALRYADCRELLRELSKIVGKDSRGTTLVDSESGNTRVQPLLSPPPAETMGHIRVAVQDGAARTDSPASAGRSAAALGATVAAHNAPPSPSPAPTPPAATGRRQLLTLVALVPLVVVGLWLMNQWGGPKSDESGSNVEAHDRDQPLADVAPNIPAVSPVDLANLRQPDGSIEGPSHSTPGSENDETKIDPPDFEPEAEIAPPIEIALPPPDLALDSLEPLFTNGLGVEISGIVRNRTDGEVILEDEHGNTIDEAAIVNGQFELSAADLSEGDHELGVVMDGVRKPVRVISDRTLPLILEPELPKILSQHTYDLRLRVEEAHLETVVVTTATGELEATQDEESIWMVAVPLAEGSNSLTATATDQANNQGVLTLVLEVDTTPPALLTVLPAIDEELVPGPTDFRLTFSETNLNVTLDGSESLALDGSGSVLLTKQIAAGVESFVLLGNVLDAAGNELPLDLTWSVRSEPDRPEGWTYDETAGYSEGFRAKRIVDPRTEISFVLMPDSVTYIAETEVTRHQWTKAGRALNAAQENQAWSAEHPITCISWKEALSFCKTFGYELPSRKQWRDACLAGAAGPYFCPLKELPKYAVFGCKQPSAVHGRSPNKYGLFHMQGNVWEWCSDENQAVGGSFYSTEKYLSVNEAPKDARVGTPDIGFRPVYRVRDQSSR